MRHHLRDERHRDRQIAPHGVAERQHRDDAVLAVRQLAVVRQDVRAGRDVGTAAIPRALRPARGPGRVDDDGRVVGAHGGGQPGQRVGISRERGAARGLDLRERAHARMPVREQRARVHDQHRAHRRAVVQHRQRLVEVLLVLDDDDGGPAVLEEVAHLARRRGGIDAVGDRPQRLDGEIGDRPLGARIADDRHALAARHRVLAREAEGDGAHALGELTPRGLTPDAQLLGAKGDAGGATAGAIDEEARERGRAQRLEVHGVGGL